MISLIYKFIKNWKFREIAIIFFSPVFFKFMKRFFFREFNPPNKGALLVCKNSVIKSEHHQNIPDLQTSKFVKIELKIWFQIFEQTFFIENLICQKRCLHKFEKLTHQENITDLQFKKKS